MRKLILQMQYSLDGFVSGQWRIGLDISGAGRGIRCLGGRTIVARRGPCHGRGDLSRYGCITVRFVISEISPTCTSSGGIVESDAD
jgi:hypothetical protein